MKWWLNGRFSHVALLAGCALAVSAPAFAAFIGCERRCGNSGSYKPSGGSCGSGWSDVS
jgi:hypothetical protein